MLGPATQRARRRNGREAVLPVADETYTFYSRSDNGARLCVNGQRIINNWSNATGNEVKATIALKSNQAYSIKLEYFEQTGTANASLRWSSPSIAKQIVPAVQLLAQ